MSEIIQTESVTPTPIKKVKPKTNKKIGRPKKTLGNEMNVCSENDINIMPTKIEPWMIKENWTKAIKISKKEFSVEGLINSNYVNSIQEIIFFGNKQGTIALSLTDDDKLTVLSNLNVWLNEGFFAKFKGKKAILKITSGTETIEKIFSRVKITTVIYRDGNYQLLLSFSGCTVNQSKNNNQ